MSTIRQDNLFDMHELFERESIHRFNAICSTLELDPPASRLRQEDAPGRAERTQLRCHDLLVDRSCGGANSND